MKIEVDYYPFGMELPNAQYANSEAYRYGFNSQEKSPEINNDHNTALFWEYDSRTARRWNLDPIPQTHISDYAVFKNNSILHTDILGNKPSWEPITKDGKVILKREEGDNYQTLINFFGSKENASKYIHANQFKAIQKYGDVAVAKLPEISFNETNPFSMALKDAFDNPSDFAFGFTDSKKLSEQGFFGKSYNCYYAVINLAVNKNITNWRKDKPKPGQGPAISLEDYKDFLKNNTNSVSPNSSVFGKTIINFGDQHAAIFFGKNKNNEQFVFTKNGMKVAPTIMKVKDMDGFTSDHPYSSSFGGPPRNPKGFSETSGYYTIK